MERKRLVLYTMLAAACWSAVLGQETAINDTSVAEKDTVTRHIFDFGLKLMNKIIEENGERNVVVSPTSVAGVMAMTMLGSVGQSYDEIVAQLGFSSDILANQRNHRSLGQLLDTLRTNIENGSSDGGGLTASSTEYASALFVSESVRVRQVFQEYLENVYKADIRLENFYQPDQARSDINEWVSNNTGGKLKEFLTEALPANTRMVLLSALRFSGQWERPFVPQFTLQMPFQAPTGEILVEQMLNLGYSDYVDSKEFNCHMVVLPYNDSATSLYAIMPRTPKITSLKQLLQELDAEKIEKLIELTENKTTVVRFPKMKLAAKVNLRNPLHDIGIKSIFSPETANFALMVENTPNKTEDVVLTRLTNAELSSEYVRDILNALPNPGLYVDTVLHQVEMNIDEFGTEAVAATAGIVARSSERFIADSPFFFFIRNSNTKLVTFSAAVFDPNSL